ncbi:MAG: flavin reductase family protein [Candidatus Gastranaerophilales bacterium]|nr:flavin reductase family protein [Candidatus Gastranaerophilales bacterium]
MDKNVLKNLSYGVYLVSTLDNDRPTGCIANSIMQVTHDTIAVSMNHNNFTTECIEKTKKFAISILGVDVERNLIPVFGFQSGRNVDKFKGVECFQKDDLNIIKSASGYITCEVINSTDTETHTIYIARITGGELLNEQIPMTYAYYQKVKKGKSPKTAPTYIEN